MKKLCLFFCLLSFHLINNIAIIKAQGWVKEIPTERGGTFLDEGIQINKITPANDSGFWLVGQIFDNLHSYTCFSIPFSSFFSCKRYGVLIQKYGYNGTRLWEKIYYSPNSTGTSLSPGESIMATDVVNCSDSSGLIIKYNKCLWNEFHTSFMPYETKCAKLDYDGNLIWAEKPIEETDVLLAEDNRINIVKSTSPNVIEIYNNDTIKYKFPVERTVYDFNLNPVNTNKDSMELFLPFDSAIYNYLNLSLYPYNDLKKCFSSSLIKSTSIGYYSLFVTIKYPLGARFNNNTLGYVDLFLAKLDDDFHLQYIKSIDTFHCMMGSIVVPKLVEHNNILYLNITTENKTRYKIYKVDTNGNILKTEEIPYYGQIINTRVIDNYVQWISNYSLNWNNYLFVNSTNSINLLTTTKRSHFKLIKNMSAVDYANNCTTLKDKSILLDLKYSLPQTNDYKIYALAKIDSLGNCTEANISGTIFGDRNSNCILDSTDVPLRNYSLKATSSIDTFYTTTDTAGHYELYIDTGSYNVTLLPNLIYPLWDASVCTPVKQVHLTENDTAATHFSLFPRLSCPNLTAEINTAFLRRCFPNTYKVDYCNNGTIDANNAYIDITFDVHLQFTSSTINAFPVGNNTYRFDVGNVQMGKCGIFYVEVYLDCDSTLIGQTHCSEAHIYPDTMCIESAYDGPIIHASAVCKDSVIEFRLKNKGSDMQAPKRYIVIEDQIMRISNLFQLPAGQELLVYIATHNGSTYRIEAEQAANFPAAFGDAIAAAFVEGCTQNPGDTFRVGIINDFPLYDGEPYRDIDCHENRGSIDPNEKLAYPKGVDTAHFISKTTPIDYTILFQNTGTDTAFFIKVIDTISPYLDINSIRITNVSHPYQFTRIDSNVIQFVFSPIQLVDSVTNEPGSHGFIMFKINQKANNAIGTRIENKADIIFDFNDAISTNTTFHTVGENYLRIDLISTTISTKYPTVELSVYPNPFRDKATFVIKNVLLKEPRLILFDVNGNIVKEFTSSSTNQISIYRNDLTNGMYIYKLIDGNEEVASGKIIVQ